MKWYRNTAFAAIEALEKIFNKNYQADKVIQKLLKSNKKWGSRDRKMLSQALYDIVRWKRKYEALSNADITQMEGKWKILALWSLLHDIEIPEWFDVDIRELKSQIKQEKNLPFAIKESIPDWLYETGIDEMGKENFEKEIRALNEEAETVIRANSLKTNPQKLKNILQKEGITGYQKKEFPDALFIEGKPKLTHLRSYKEGLFEIQDASSQKVADFINPKPGETIIDACAGAGGKSLHLAAKMKNKGNILAYDIYPRKLKELTKRAKRNGVKIIKETGLISPKIVEKNKETADILVLDVPCSSLGTLKRKPGLKWKQKPENLNQIKILQKNILKDYAKMVKPGGYLVYITCSILPSENRKQVEEFLSSNKNFTFVEELKVLPSKNGYDGFYMAKLQRIN